MGGLTPEQWRQKQFGAELKMQDQQEAELTKLLQEPRRWKTLPPFVKAVTCDSSGRFWYSMEGVDEQAFHESVARAAAGKTQAIRGGKVLLVDRSGRFWVCRESWGCLECYDPAQKKWVEQRLATGEASGVADGQSAQRRREGSFNDSAWEDSAGNLYFVGGYEGRVGVGIHRRTADGKWSFQVLRPPHEEKLRFLGHDPLLFFEQDGGRVLIIMRNAQRQEEQVVVRFNGAKWEVLDPRVCKQDDVKMILPLRDGSIVTLCRGNLLWTWWPSDLLPLRIKECQTLVEQLGSGEAATRNQATAKLRWMGHQLLPTLKAQLTSVTNPEARQRLRGIVQGMEQEDRPNHGPKPLVGGRFGGMFELLSRNRAGDWRFLVDNCKDETAHKEYEEAVVTRKSDGTWDVAEIDEEKWREAGVKSRGTDLLEDASAGIWLTGGVRVDAGNGYKASAALLQGNDQSSALFQGKDGQVCLRSGGYMLFDPIAPAGKGDLPQELIVDRTVHQRDGQTWVVDTKQQPPVLQRLDKALQVIHMPAEPPDTNPAALLPLKSGGMIVQAYSESIAMGNRTMLWDGQTWQGPSAALELVKANVALLTKEAGHEFTETDDDGRLRIAADGNGGLWFAEELYDAVPQGAGATQKHVRRFQYYDGSAWHDAWAELEQQDANYKKGQILRAVDGGKGVLMQVGINGEIVLVRFDGQRVRGTKLLDRDPDPRLHGPFAVRAIEGPGGEVWIESADNRLILYRDGAAKKLPLRLELLLGDSKGRLWAFAPHDEVLQVKVGEKWVTARMAGLTWGESRMVEGPEGRLWLVNPDGLIQVGVREGGEKPAIKELGRWKWDTAKSRLGRVFCDTAGGLWVCGESVRHMRYTLPGGKAQAAPASRPAANAKP
jgi:hypothetical protein